MHWRHQSSAKNRWRAKELQRARSRRAEVCLEATVDYLTEVSCAGLLVDDGWLDLECLFHGYRMSFSGPCKPGELVGGVDAQRGRGQLVNISARFCDAACIT
mmetsp:Transcript_55082/g.101978  ORF Transcript_55082/g.101978 Transcript_55082/m.101978 type:complete len:102 (-) Transcript_55082:161-466(-)